ncbi:hypothetical protein [Deinococcus ruber]|uniref:hypothetical protein n=1 Tax=Deinococcus ruber TaxID=1848197 RepID=UPI00166C26A4|nr:hypothetical protein [Deinococcus ruber]
MASSFDPGGLDEDLALDVFAANLRLEHHGALEQAEQLAARLQQLLPHLTHRTDQRRWPFGRPALARLRIKLGGDHFDLLVQNGQVHYRTVHHVSGVDLAHQELRQDEWIRLLLEALAAQSAQVGQSARSLL